MDRKATIERNTAETEIRLTLNLDGTGLSVIRSGIPFLDHMLTLMTAHGFMDLEMTADGDTEIDDHHTVEDIGICLGMALKKALGDKKGLKRYGEATVPMDEAMARVVMDISNRPFLAYRVSPQNSMTGHFDIKLLKEFFRALVNHSGLTLHVDLISGEDAHHIAESIFKAFGRALDEAAGMERRRLGEIPSTKGTL